jgi:glycosyltransferase involved in cell wall biosynthesis
VKSKDPSDSVSVVMGSYNAAAWIGATVESILAQTHPVAEIIIVDDGSVDQTAEIARSYGAQITLVQEQHRGRPHRNRGIELSKGAYVAFIDADDRWHPVKIERQLARLHELKTEWVVCEAEWLDSATEQVVRPAGSPLMEGDILEPLLLHNFIVASSPIVSRSVLGMIGGFDEGEDTAPVEDWDLWLRIAGRYPLAGVRERLVTVRLHDDSFLASTPMARKVRSVENVINRAVLREPARLTAQRGLALHNAYFAAGVGAFRHGHPGEARGYFLKAWQQRKNDAMALAYIGISWLPSRLSRDLARLKRRILGGA